MATHDEPPQLRRGVHSVMVTGAFGSVGRGIVFALLASGRRVVAVDLPTVASRAAALRLRASGHPFEFVELDLRDAHAVDDAVRRVRPEAVIHLAAMLPPFSEIDADATRAVNATGTENLVRSLARWAPTSRVVLASSYAVYGARSPHLDLQPIDDATPERPSDTYGTTKLEAEHAVRRSGLPYVILRIGAAIPFTTRTGMLHMLRMLLEIPPDQRRHAIDPRDVALAFVRAVERDSALGKTLRIGGGEGWRLESGQLTALQMRALGVPAVPSSLFCPGDPSRRDTYFTEDWMDTTESQALLSYQTRSVEDYLEESARRFGPSRHVLPFFAPVLRRAFELLSPYRGPGESTLARPLSERIRGLLRASADSAHVRARVCVESKSADIRRILDHEDWRAWSGLFVGLARRGDGRGAIGLRGPFGSSIYVPVTMLRVTEDEIRWRGGIPGVFQGEHYFHLHTAEGVAVLDHGEQFTGVLGVPVVRWLRPIVDAAYRREAAALAIAADRT